MCGSKLDAAHAGVGSANKTSQHFEKAANVTEIKIADRTRSMPRKSKHPSNGIECPTHAAPASLRALSEQAIHPRKK
jgi:hypothetical protein